MIGGAPWSRLSSRLGTRAPEIICPNVRSASEIDRSRSMNDSKRARTYIGTDGGSWSDLLALASAEPFVGYFFSGGRLLVDRFFDGEGCDILVTRGDTSRIRNASTELLRLGAPGTEDWRAMAEAIARRLPA